MKNYKGVIVAAGYGSRFLPVTKSIPKEMLPLINIPCIEFIVQEMVESGIKDIIFITQRRKKALEDYFDKEVELTDFFSKNNKIKELQLLEKFHDVSFAFIRQKEMKGTGDALLLAKDWIGDSPFIVAYPDDLVFSSKSLSTQIIEIYEKYKKNVLAVMEIDTDVSRYGVVDYSEKIENRVYAIKGIVEKPQKGSEPSRMISIGRYLFTPEIFDKLLEKQKSHQKGEFYLTEGIAILSQEKKVLAYEFEGKRLDTGQPTDYLESILEYAYTQEQYKTVIDNFVKNKVKL